MNLLVRAIHESPLLLYFCTFLLAAPAWAAPTFDAASTASCVNCASINVPAHAIGGGCSNSILVVGTSWDISTGVTLSGVAATGGALTSRASTIDGDENHTINLSSRVGLSGSQSVTATFSGTTYLATLSVSSYCGVDPTTPHGTATADGSSGTTASVTVASATDELVVDVIMAHTTLAVGADQTQRINAASDIGAFGSSDEPGAASVTMSWNLALSHYWGIIAIPVRPYTAPVSPGGTRRQVVGIQ